MMGAKCKKLPDAEFLRSILDYDAETGELMWRARSDMKKPIKWNSRYAGKRAFTALNQHGYRIGTVNSVTFLAHRVAYKILTGIEPLEVDHINGDRTDNRAINIRSVSNAENCKNLKVYKTNKTGYPGIRKMGGKCPWAAEIRHNNQLIQLGRFGSF